MLLLEDDSLDPGGVVLDEDDCEAVLEDVAAVPLPRLFLKGDDTVLKEHIIYVDLIVH